MGAKGKVSLPIAFLLALYCWLPKIFFFLAVDVPMVSQYDKDDGESEGNTLTSGETVRE